jgi:O-antigen/teichoic acid export membrane protein
MSVDSGTRSRLIWGFISQWVSKLSYTAIQLIQVPFFLHFWSENVYGEWLIINALPNYLLFSNLGFATVAGNEMSMSVAKGDRDAALRVFQSCWWLITLTMTITGLAVIAALKFLPLARILNVHDISESDAKWCIAYLGITILLGQLEGMMQSAYRAVDRNPFGSFLRSVMTILAFAATMIPVWLGYGPRTTAKVFAFVTIAGIIVMGVMTRRAVPWIRYGWQHASFAEIKRLTAPAFAFMGFPMGLALNLQGTLLVISHTLGPIAVVVFATARTVSRVALQMVQMVNTTFEPEFSKSFAMRDFKLIRTLHRHACQSALLLSGLIVIAMIAGGPFLLSHWTHGKVPPSRPLLSILLLVVIVYSLWSTSSTILTATNQHKRLAAVYVGATGVTVLVTWAASRGFGLFGAAASLVISEILMNLYVLPNTLRIAHDTFPAFMRSLLDVPPALHPSAMFRRLRRARDPVI